MNYESHECVATQTDGAMTIRRRDNTGGVVIQLLRRPAEAWAVMLELDGDEREALLLPSCEAVTGGTALCLARADKAADGTVPLPKAPTCWDELVEAELWPMTWIGAHKGMKATIVLENEQ